MIKVLSELYNATFKKNRGAAAQGFIRPTLGQYFMTHKDFTEVEMDISRDYIWTADVFPTEAVYPFNTKGDYAPILQDSGLYFNINMGLRTYSRIIPEATSDVGMTVKFEVRTNNNPTNWARASCYIFTNSIIGSESKSLCLAVTRDGIYNWAGDINPSNYYLVNCLVFNSFLWQISESSWKLFINDQTFPIIITSHTAIWSNELTFGDGTSHTTPSNTFAEWRLVGARAGIWGWNDF